MPQRLRRAEEQEPRVDDHGAEDRRGDRLAVLRVFGRAHHGVVPGLEAVLVLLRFFVRTYLRMYVFPV